MHVSRIPISDDNKDTRTSATPPVWIDNRYVLVDDGKRVWRVDTKRDKADEMKKIPIPTQRRKHSMIASPGKEQLAVEVQTDDGFELRVISLI